MLNTSQAAAMAGYSIDTIYTACKSGALTHEKERPGGRRGGGYRIAPDVLMAWAKSPSAPRGHNYEPWTDADVAALIELHRSDSCTREQIAAYLGRSFESVKLKTGQLRREGLLTTRMSTHKSPFHIPPGGVLIARTCIACGLLRDASYFSRHVGGYQITTCRLCVRSDAKGRAERSPSRKVREQLNDVTRQRAFNEGQRYSDDEVEQLHDKNRTDLDLALKLGRSFYAVWNKRLKLGLKPKASKWLDLPDVQWHIEFPKAMDALREHFRSIGEAVPEELWEWTDESEAVA